MADEYIKREDAKKAFCEVCDWNATALCEECHHPLDFVPAADVRPVVHARITEDGACPVCGCYIPTDDAHDAIFKSEVHYCYYCGADMREVDDED